MTKLNYRDLYLLCEVTQERIKRVEQLIVNFSYTDDKTKDAAVISRELVEAYQAEKLELEVLLSKLQALKLEV